LFFQFLFLDLDSCLDFPSSVGQQRRRRFGGEEEEEEEEEEADDEIYSEIDSSDESELL
jgi:hypothetical protein